MIDIPSAKIVELAVDNTGKLWLNVDGKCELRIGQCDMVITNSPSPGQSSGSITTAIYKEPRA